MDRGNQKATTAGALDKRYAHPQDSPRIAFGSNPLYDRSQRRGRNQSNRVVSLHAGPVTSSITHIHSNVDHVSRQAVKGCWIMIVHDIVKRVEPHEPVFDLIGVSSDVDIILIGQMSKAI